MFTLFEPTTKDLIANELQVEYSNMWRPSNETLFHRLRKKELLSLGQSWLGDKWAKTSNEQKKSVLCQLLLDVFLDVNHKREYSPSMVTGWIIREIVIFK